MALSITVVSYFNGKIAPVCDFYADRGSSEQVILDLAKKAISHATNLPVELLTLYYDAGTRVHISNTLVPQTPAQCSEEHRHSDLQREEDNGWLDRAFRETAKKTKDFKENKTKETSST